jgi:hypothetical protein
MNEINLVYCVDLDSSCPEVLEFSGSELHADLVYYNVSNPVDLSDYERRIFRNEVEAEAFVKSYNEVLSNLDKYCKRSNTRDTTIPCMIYKRRYIALSILGLKLQTVRHYKKRWQPGQFFNLNDQCYFLTVRLLKLSEYGSSHYKYEFEVV